MTSRTSLRRFEPHKPRGAETGALAEDHPAVVEGRPLFPTVAVDQSPRLLVSGHNNRKIGKVVQKGAWAGFPIFTLTLPERSTCPRSCEHWRDCYGNAMHWARRHEPGGLFEDVLAVEIMQAAVRHPEGFVVRLHVLGDFYSTGYVDLWGDLLERFPALHVWGYTGYRPNAEDPGERRIGRAVERVRGEFPDRFKIRVSGVETTVVDKAEEATDARVCPAELSQKAACATCAWCWEREDRIAFIRHGMVHAKTKGAPRGPRGETKTARILELADDGLTADLIAERVGSTPAYVRAAASRHGKSLTMAKRGRKASPSEPRRAPKPKPQPEKEAESLEARSDTKAPVRTSWGRLIDRSGDVAMPLIGGVRR